jgi:hypothetical protein
MDSCNFITMILITVKAKACMPRKCGWIRSRARPKKKDNDKANLSL